MKRIYALLLSFTLSVPNVFADEQTSANQAKLAQQIQTLINEKALPGMVVQVKRGKNLVFNQAIGYADIENQTPMSLQQPFRWFSMSKPVTALALLKTIQDNGFALDATIQDMYPNFDVDTAVPITSLLTHTSGFGYGGAWDSFSGWLYWLLGPLERADSLPELMSKLDGIPLLSEPGSEFRYSMSSDVQGAIIQRVNQQNLARYLDEKLFHPLNMRNTAFVTKNQHNSNLATFYRYDGEAKHSVLVNDPTEWDKQVLSGGGGLYGTADDYMKFLDVLRYPQEYDDIVPVQLVERMKQNQLPAHIGAIPAQIYPDTGYGFGLGVKLNDEEYLSQGSYYWAGLAGTIFVVDPQQDLAIVVMTQLLGGRRLMEREMIPMIYQWLREQ